MEYRSTRGAKTCEFPAALLGGLGQDGGLLLPLSWARPGPLTEAGYAATVFAHTYPYVEPALTEDEYRRLVAAAHERIPDPPLVRLQDDLWLLDLSLGPSLAFKDFALQLLGPLFARFSTARGERRAMNVLVATSGDTGAAAAAALSEIEGLNLFILHPKGRISPLQRRQMTTIGAKNVHNLAIEGDFDDCQAIVKTLLADGDFVSVNSVNWARIAAQTAYYGWATAKLAEVGVTNPRFVVPTGNFGNIFACYVAKKAGVEAASPTIAAVNANDGLERLLTTGRLKLGPALPTLSPSMDIQVPSNFERMLFELVGDHGRTAELMEKFARQGVIELPPTLSAKLRAEFAGYSTDDRQTLKTMAEVYKNHGLMIDPHTAVGVAAAKKARAELGGPFCCLATAAAAKFPQAVERATGKKPPIPPALAGAVAGRESFTALPPDIGEVRAYIKKHV